MTSTPSCAMSPASWIELSLLSMKTVPATEASSGAGASKNTRSSTAPEPFSVRSICATPSTPMLIVWMPPSVPPGIATSSINWPFSSKRRMLPPSSASRMFTLEMKAGSSNSNQMVPPSALSSGSLESLSSEMISTLSPDAVKSKSSPVGLAPSKIIASFGEVLLELPSPSRWAEIVTPSN